MTTKRKGPGRPATGHGMFCPLCGAPLKAIATAKQATLPDDAVVRRLICTQCKASLSTVETAITIDIETKED